MGEPAVHNIEEILKQAQELFDAACRRKNLRLKVTGHSTDKEWLYIVVSPTKAGIGAYEYTQVLTAVEKKLRAHGDENILLVPAKDD